LVDLPELSKEDNSKLSEVGGYLTDTASEDGPSDSLAEEEPRGDGPRGDGPRGDGPRGDGPRGDGAAGGGRPAGDASDAPAQS
ncbi:MAG: hypothetical protein WD119_02185, partial [Pirellulaceae bacterium]